MCHHHKIYASKFVWFSNQFEWLDHNLHTCVSHLASLWIKLDTVKRLPLMHSISKYKIFQFTLTSLAHRTNGCEPIHSDFSIWDARTPQSIAKHTLNRVTFGQSTLMLFNNISNWMGMCVNVISLCSIDDAAM